MNKAQKDKILASLRTADAEVGILYLLDNDTAVSMLVDYINTHKWLVNERIPFTITSDQAVFSWYDNAYRPMMYAINNSIIGYVMRDLDFSTIISRVSDKHYELNTKVRNKVFIPYEKAVKEVILEHTNNPFITLYTKLFY